MEYGMGSTPKTASLRRYDPDQVLKGLFLSRFSGTPCSDNFFF
jgi:hypothetical protein